VHVAGFFSYMNRVVQAIGADSKAQIAAQSQTHWSSAPVCEAHT
jgi:hypothetical protein